MKYLETVKFGGSPLDNSVYSINMFEGHVIYRVNMPAILVISAFKNMTNRLERLAVFINSKKREMAEKEKEEILKAHLATAYNIFPTDNEVFKMIVSIVDSIDIDKLTGKDFRMLCGQIMGKGEDISSLIVSEYLRFKGIENELVDSREFIVTDKVSDGEIILEKTKGKIQKFFESKKSPLITMQGYIGKDELGRSSTLKREDSDLSAAGTAIELSTDLIFYKKRGVQNAPKEIIFGKFLELETSQEKGLLSERALKMLGDNKKEFWIINFDNPTEKTRVHF